MTKGAIVVGAGPVGLMLAGELRLGGADVAIYDKLPAPSGESRGVGFTRRAAEVFDQRGLLERFGEVEWAQGHFGGVRIDFSMLTENHFSVRGVPQFRTERILEEWLGELGVSVRRGYEFVDYEETSDGITATFAGPEGTYRDTAQYLVGCDGGRSTVRQRAGIEFPGLPATRGMFMADLLGTNIRPRPIGERVEGGMVMAFNLEDGVDRIVIHESGLSPHHDKDSLSFTEVADAWQRMTGESLHGAEVRWVSSFTNATRQAAEYRRGRVLLAGDSTHVQLPAGAQGLSVGVQDAVNLGWKLAATINDTAPPHLLDTYHSERHPVGQQLLRNTQAQAQLYLTGNETEPLRAIMRELVTHPDTAEHLAGLVSGLSVQYPMPTTDPHPHPLLGKRMPPHRQLQLADGRHTTVAQLLHPARTLLITTAPNPALKTTTDRYPHRLTHHTATWTNPITPHLPTSLLVRPDGYVAWTSTDPTTEGLEDALTHWLGTPE